MKAPLWRLARAAWGREGSRPAPVLGAVLRPFSGAFGAVSWLRGRYYDRTGGRRVPGIAVVSVGNLAVGGTGKTPLAAWAARALAARGARPAVVLRGYGADEVALHRSWSAEVPVIAAADRVDGVRAARDGGAGVAVLDDGFQHRRLARDLDVVLVAVEDPLPPRLLPAGPYREPWSALSRAHVVVLTRRTASLDAARRVEEAVGRAFPRLPVACVELPVTSWTDLAGAPAAAPEGRTLVVAAVARPEAVRAMVEHATGSEAELLPFPDHHDFTPEDLRGIARRAAGRPVVVTRKDAVKLAALTREGSGASSVPLPRVHVAVEALRWDWGEAEVRSRLERLTRRDRYASERASADATGDRPPEARDSPPAPDPPPPPPSAHRAVAR